ncbi:hypothetical protein PF005_g6073 [Phytophthora fragariae]|uniref:Uncharacterized protein n=1 Tax=Phytophthora fragariae TaxID=53985 RepID=A0A6A3USY3_9STRA|nr:hypothetical protein PF003_g17763 [Phytophthora fragariae]KAE8943462.1 hypothetical protein PF009_g6811 [Phytophthora fragariae]KAE9026276.1 hypothetical protein PF011_g2640 [Phytophthora fragariae]KAE9150108.1 hypothetical protein PF006_g5474 [Phytophthora fragariae]KAE9224015.1 hypothetical protein PF005_g6073 [Phytophthora fragariae]
MTAALTLLIRFVCEMMGDEGIVTLNEVCEKRLLWT